MKSIVFILMMAVSFLANASCVQTGNVLDGLVGLDSSTSTVYARTNSIKNQCSCSSVRFKFANTNTNMALSILLAAKMAGKTVRVDLNDPSDCNTASRVYVEK